MRQRLLFLLLALLTLTGTALAAFHTDRSGDIWYLDEAGFPVPEEPSPQAAATEADPALIPLGDPSNLRWETWAPGQVYWETEGAFQMTCDICFYEMNAPETIVYEEFIQYPADFTGPFGVDFFAASAASLSSQGGVLPTGDYFFTVQNIGDGTEYSDSRVVSSRELDGGVYHYVDPGEGTTLEAPSNVHWEWPAICWDDRKDEDSRINVYAIDYGYSAEKADIPDMIRSIGGSVAVRSGEVVRWLQEELISENGAGWYYFRVRPLSANIEKWRNGPWSPWSEGYNLKEAAQKITDQLNQIDKDASEEEIRQQVQTLSQTDLNNALTADILEAGTGTAEALLRLEEALGGPARASVEEAFRDKFDASRVSVVGAALNNVTEAPVLNIGAPKDSHDVRDENYNNTVAVDFSMELENVENTHDLAVPVKVTLPIPEGINPAFLVILHYPYDSSYPEEVLHTTFPGEDGQQYVSFVLTSFSDFTLTERAVPGKAASITTDGRQYEAVNAPEGAKLCLARYEGGRMTSFAELDGLTGTLEGAGKLFLLDRQFHPLCAAAEVR